MTRLLTALLAVCFVATSAHADDTVRLRKNHPESYVVAKGDTLWDISSRFLRNPWLWPKVWQMNRDEIKNPHLIYPGDVIALDMSSGSPRLRLLRGATLSPRGGRNVTLQPHAVVEPLERDAIKPIQPNVIAPFLSQPLIVNEKDMATNPEIVGGQDNRVVMSQGTRIYINKITKGEPLRWHIYRQGEILRDPDTKIALGREAIYLGEAKITRYGEPASGEVTKQKEEIFPKDRLIAFTEKPQAAYIPHPPETLVRGKIIKIYGGVAETGKGNIVAISRGAADGLDEGSVLTIYRTGKYVTNPNAAQTKNLWESRKLPVIVDSDDPNKRLPASSDRAARKQKEDDAKNPKLLHLPDERVGLLMVFRTFDHVAYGLVMESTEPIDVNDTVATPGDDGETDAE